MSVVTTNDYITTEELNAVIEATRGLKIWDGGEVKGLDRIKFATFDRAFAKASKDSVHSIQGGYRFMVKGNRNQRIHWYHGSKKLKYSFGATPFHFDYYVGKGQLGNQQLIDYLERAGIKVVLSKELRQGGVPEDKQQVIFNVLKEERDDIEYARKLDLARRFWTGNTDAPDCFSGYDALFPATTNISGSQGGVSRTNYLARHQLITNVTANNVNLAFAQAERAVQDAGGHTDWIVCGDNWFDMLLGLYQGTTTQAGKYQIEVGYEKAREYSSKFRVALPDDSFIGPNGTLIMREPLFRKLDGWGNDAVKWADRLYGIDFSSFFLLPERWDEFVNFGMPYDQLVNYSSTFDSLCLGTNNPGAQFVMVKG